MNGRPADKPKTINQIDLNILYLALFNKGSIYMKKVEMDVTVMSIRKKFLP